MNGKQGLTLVAVALALSACSASRNMLGLGDAPAPSSQPTIQTGNPLALPPDLALRRPGATAPAYQANSTTGQTMQTAETDYAEPLDTQTPVAPAAPVVKQDVFDQYGVSKTNADGTRKTQEQLQDELRLAVRKRKQQQNPNYGTIFNMGSIFSDG